MKRLMLVFCFLCFAAMANAQTNTAIKANPICFVDGKQIPDSVYGKLFQIINPKDVSSIKKLKSKEAIARYGAAGANGAVIITTKLHTLPAKLIYPMPPVDTSNLVAQHTKPTVINFQERSARSINNDSALVILDGVIYKGGIRSLDPNTVESIIVLKDSAARSMYGEKGAHGVIILKTKHITGKLMPPQPVSSRAQAPAKSGSSLVLVDGEVYKGDVDKIAQQNIIDIVISQKPTIDPKDGSHYDGGVTIITRPYAKVAYQKKFSTLSKKYKAYIDEKHNDDNLQYVLNNNMIDIKNKSAITDLYQLSPDNIDKVEFKTESRFKADATVVITTKDE